MNNQFADNPFYVQYEALLKELHHLIAAGKGNGDKADAVRDEMDAPEQKLSQKEIMRLNGLSADLYMLQDAEVYEPYDGTQEDLRQAINDAHRSGDCEELLKRLRKGPKFIPAVGMASIRATAYEQLGHLDTALVFLRFASRIASETGRTSYQQWFQTQIIDLLVRLNRYDDAVAEVERSLGSLTIQDFRFIAAYALLICAEHLSLNRALPLYRQSASILESILTRDVERAKLSSQLVATAYHTLDESYRQIVNITDGNTNGFVNGAVPQFRLRQDGTMSFNDAMRQVKAASQDM